MNDSAIIELHKAFDKIFALPINRSTFRQLQNALFSSAQGNKDVVNVLFQSLLNGEIKNEGGLNAASIPLQKFIERFSGSAFVAKEVFENGEFIGLVSSDLLDQQQRVLFSNTIRRVDGKELVFVSDLQSTLQIIHHFIARLADVKNQKSLNEALKSHEKDIALLKKNLSRLLDEKK